MKTNIEELSLSDLNMIKSILEKRLQKKWHLVELERGHNYEIYCRLESIYDKDEDHCRIGKINKRIKDIINNI